MKKIILLFIFCAPYFLALAQSEMPKKVALVSFYSFDPGMTKIQRWRSKSSDFYYTYTTQHTKVTKRNAVGGSGELAVGYYLQSIDALIDGFNGFGMELLLPEEYLDTDAKAEFYNNFVVERGKFNEWLANMGSGSHDVIFGYPEGFNVLDVVNEPYGNYTSTGGQFLTKKGDIADNQVWVMDKCGPMVESLGDKLCNGLGVDAVVIVYFTIFSPKDDKVELENVNMHMFGPNPTKLPEGQDSKFNYFSGQFYVGTRVNAGIPIWKKDKKNPDAELEFTGFENIMSALTTEMGTYLKEGIEKWK